jgi:hypothetical protein
MPIVDFLTMEFTVEDFTLIVYRRRDRFYLSIWWAAHDGELPSLSMVAVHRTPDVENYSGSDDGMKEASKAAVGVVFVEYTNSKRKRVTYKVIHSPRIFENWACDENNNSSSVNKPKLRS